MGDPKGWGKCVRRGVERSVGVEIDGGRFGGSAGVLRCLLAMKKRVGDKSAT